MLSARWVFVSFCCLGALAAPEGRTQPNEVETVGISLSGSSFEVRGLASGHGSHTITLGLEPERPPTLRHEPPPEGEVLYGALVLASKPERRFLLRVDVAQGQPRRLYFDADGDGELTDDPGPLTNTGTGLFATEIRIPFALLNPRAAFLGDYVFWVFASRESWRERSLRAYSLSQLQGSVPMGDARVAAWVVERLPYDGDLTNDGLCVDLDFDGKAKSSGECRGPGEPFELRHGHLVEREASLATTEAVHRRRFLVDW